MMKTIEVQMLIWLIWTEIINKILWNDNKQIKISWILIRTERERERERERESSHICISRKHAYIILTPLKPHFFIVKLGFTGVYIIFLISAQNIDCRYSLEPPHRGGSNEYPQSMFWAETWKISEFFIWKFSVFRGEIFYTIE